MIFNNKDKEFKIEPKVFNSIDYTRIDRAINDIKIDFNDNFDDLEEMNLDFDHYINMPKFNPLHVLNHISINIPEYEDNYQTINIDPFINVMQPFTYSSIRNKNGENYKRISRLTPSSQWPKIDFSDEQKLNYKDGE